MACAIWYGDGGGSLIYCCHLRIQFNHAFFLGTLSIPGINFIGDPGGETFSNNGIDNIGSILPCELVYFLFYCWESSPDLIVWLCKFEHEFNLQTFKEWYWNVFDIRIFDDLLFATSKITKVKNSNILKGWKISTTIDGNKAVNLSFTLIFSSEGRRADKNSNRVRIWWLTRVGFHINQSKSKRYLINKSKFRN